MPPDPNRPPLLDSPVAVMCLLDYVTYYGAQEVMKAINECLYQYEHLLPWDKFLNISRRTKLSSFYNYFVTGEFLITGISDQMISQLIELCKLETATARQALRSDLLIEITSQKLIFALKNKEERPDMVFEKVFRAAHESYDILAYVQTSRKNMLEREFREALRAFHSKKQLSEEDSELKKIELAHPVEKFLDLLKEFIRPLREEFGKPTIYHVAADMDYSMRCEQVSSSESSNDQESNSAEEAEKTDSEHTRNSDQEDDDVASEIRYTHRSRTRPTEPRYGIISPVRSNRKRRSDTSSENATSKNFLNDSQTNSCCSPSEETLSSRLIGRSDSPTSLAKSTPPTQRFTSLSPPPSNWREKRREKYDQMIIANQQKKHAASQKPPTDAEQSNSSPIDSHESEGEHESAEPTVSQTSPGIGLNNLINRSNNYSKGCQIKKRKIWNPKEEEWLLSMYRNFGASWTKILSEGQGQGILPQNYKSNQLKDKMRYLLKQMKESPSGIPTLGQRHT